MAVDIPVNIDLKVDIFDELSGFCVRDCCFGSNRRKLDVVFTGAFRFQY